MVKSATTKTTKRKLTGYETVADAQDAREILWTIAIDPHLPANSRVAAAKALLQDARAREKAAGVSNNNPGSEPVDLIAARAEKIMSDLKKRTH
jgi:hypothetical protein